ncbi:MAG: SDR family oxidoreductase [Candidatus Nanopelagicaceae bacterium]|nr:SDR family oxidoreductase [Candidatus Nanopelagicaceae bacterium]
MARTYVVTGAASGIGAATSVLLKERGAKVIGVDIHNTDINADLSTSAGRKDAARSAIKLSGGSIDGIIPCAGLAHPIAQTVSVNYFGVTEFLTELLPTLKNSSAPRVAITSSMASLLPNSPELVDAMLANDEAGALLIAQGLVDQGPETAGLIYGSTKRALSRWIRRECIKSDWAGAGIPLNAVGPGIVETPMVAEMIATAESRAAIDAMVPMPLNYYLKARQVSYLLAWLISEENTHTTGQTIYIDGGSDASIRGDNIWS